MKASTTFAFIAAFAPYILSSPIEKRQDFDTVDYPDGTGQLHEYPAGTGSLHEYPPGTGENLPIYPGTGCQSSIFNFTSTYHVVATPDQVVNGTGDNPTFTGGLKDAQGFYDFGINVDLDLICYSIKLVGFRGEYQSPASTSTHVHEAAKGKNGPPRLAFPNPVGEGDVRYSFGCLQSPFTTGLKANGRDTGAGFKVAQIEDNPSAFMADVHSSLAVPGAVRGQLA